MPWNQSKRTVEKKPKVRINYKALVGVSFVLLISVIAWLMIPADENIENTESSSKTKKIATTKKLKEKKTPKATTNVVKQTKANPTFHVREQNPSGCWGFARRSSLHGISRRYPRRFAANHPVTRRYAAKKVRRRGERGKSGYRLQYCMQ